MTSQLTQSGKWRAHPWSDRATALFRVSREKDHSKLAPEFQTKTCEPLCMPINRHSSESCEYANHEYFCRLFQEELASLYQLAFLLTGNHEKAESILVAGLDDCVNGNRVFQQWARSWARRVIIKGAIRVLAPVTYESDERITKDQAQLQRDVFEHAIARLSTFNRFVFIMSVLERIPDRECAALLGCQLAAIEGARIQALQTIASDHRQTPDQKIA